METFFKKKNLEYFLPFFLGGHKCGRGVGPGCKGKHFLDQVFNPNISGNNDQVWAFFFHG
jgi:hypothetical protein